MRVKIKAVILFICRCSYQLNSSGRYFSSSCPHVALGDKTAMYLVNLPFHDQPSKLRPRFYNAIENFLRSDHVPFWDSYPSMSAIFLSDTADHRSYMVSCYHQDCDNINRVTSEMLQFLQKTSDSIVAVANDVTKLSCPESGTIIHSYSDNSGILYIEYKGSPIGLSRYGISLILTSGFGILRQNRARFRIKSTCGRWDCKYSPWDYGIARNFGSGLQD